MIVSRTDLAVLKPFRIGAAEPWRFSVWHGVALLLALIVAIGKPPKDALSTDDRGCVCSRRLARSGERAVPGSNG